VVKLVVLVVRSCREVRPQPVAAAVHALEVVAGGAVWPGELAHIRDITGIQMGRLGAAAGAAQSGRYLHQAE